jgi:hypothetical protein
MELGGRAAYHAKEVLVRDKENKRTRNASTSANSPRCVLGTGLCVRVCFSHSHQKT